jgi:hypothetical protein
MQCRGLAVAYVVGRTIAVLVGQVHDTVQHANETDDQGVVDDTLAVGVATELPDLQAVWIILYDCLPNCLLMHHARTDRRYSSRTTQRKPAWQVDVSSGWAMRAAGR